MPGVVASPWGYDVPEVVGTREPGPVGYAGGGKGIVNVVDGGVGVQG